MGLYDPIDQGWLDELIRNAFAERGFAPNQQIAVAARGHAESTGAWVCGEVIPAHLPAYAGSQLCDEVARLDPELWGYLELVTGSGFRHTLALHELVGVTPASTTATALLGAIFWGVIAVSDTLVDEYAEGPRLLTLLDRLPFSAGLTPLRASIAEGYRAADEPRHRLLLALMDVFLEQTCAVGAGLGRSDLLPAILARIGGLYRAQRRVCEAQVWSLAEARAAMADVATKSVQPSLLLAYLAALGSQGRDGLAAGYSGAAAVGRLIWLADDLGDLSEDWAQGAPSRAVAALLRHGREGLAVAVPVVVTELADQVMALLNKLRMDPRPAARPLAHYAEESLAGWMLHGALYG